MPGFILNIHLFHFLKHFAEREQKKCRLSQAVINTFLKYDWPGNVRELANAIEHGFADDQQDCRVDIRLHEPSPNRLLVEVEEGKTDAQAYVERDPDGKAVMDYVVLTPRAQRTDPCEAMRAAMKARQK